MAKRIGRAEKWRDACEARYTDATHGKRRTPEPTPDLSPGGLYQQTGDPLFLSEPDLARRTYGLDTAVRPNVRARHVSDAIFGSELDAFVELARALCRRPRSHALPPGMAKEILNAREQLPRWSADRAAHEAVALAAERGTWLGKTEPISFDDAVKRVRKALGKPPPDHSNVGNTGRWLRVSPAPGKQARSPEPPFAPLQVDTLVSDTLFWRRREADGDIVVLARIEKKCPTREK